MSSLQTYKSALTTSIPKIIYKIIGPKYFVMDEANKFLLVEK